MLNGGTSSSATDPSPLRGKQRAHQAACPPPAPCQQQNWVDLGLGRGCDTLALHKGCPSLPPVPSGDHSPRVVEAEDKVRPWGGRRKRRERAQSHVLP